MKKDYTDYEIEKIFRKYDISGDISFDEDNEHFWKRKILELHNKMKKVI